MSSNPIQAACNRTTVGHIFYHVLSPAQSLTTRVTIVVGGCLLLIGVVFAGYSAISKYFSTTSNPETGKTLEIPPYPELGKQAIESTIASLNNHPDVPTTRNFMMQPIDTRIPHLANLHWTVHYEAFEEALKNHQNDNPWAQQEVLEAADALMKASYTVSCLTLEDLKPFIDKNSKKDEHGNNTMTYAAALTMQCSYQYRTFYYCTNAYHWIRGAIVWNEKGYPEPGLDHTNSKIDDSHAQPFYEKGTIQNSWNQLYNDYCDRVRAYVKEEDLRKPNWEGGDQRHANWTKKDTGVETFYHRPDTQPT
jgi:hypothetical protein